MRAVAAALPADAVVTTDAGNFAGWYARGLRFAAGQRFLGATSGAMGYALSAAIGASIAEPGRPTVALAGDGGFAMLMAELETAVRAGAHVTALIHDNQRYGTIRLDQERSLPRPGHRHRAGPAGLRGRGRGLRGPCLAGGS